MNARRTRLLWLLVFASGCQPPTFLQVARMVSKFRGQGRWLRVEPRADAAPRPGTGASETEEESEEQLERYLSQFSPLWLEKDRPCSELTGQRPAATGTVYLLVHGVRGDGPEWAKVLPVLASARPSGIFMFPWSPTGRRGELTDALAAGVSRIAQCYPPTSQVVLLAHSAGGVLTAYAAHRIHAPPAGPRIWLLTVASPLSGVGYRKVEESETPEQADDTVMFKELGGSQSGYPAPPEGVTVIHFRTQFPADAVMLPNLQGNPPNRRGVKVQGAREVDLPAHLSHDDALLHVARELVSGRLLE